MVFGLKTNQWYNSSYLENYLKNNHPNDIKHNWVSYSGTGKNIYGSSIFFGHGRPSTAAEFFPANLEWFINNNNDESILNLYHLFISKDESKINELQERIIKLKASSEPN